MRSIFFLILLSILSQCSSSQNTSTPEVTPLAEKGRQVYMANCIACHAPDPAKDGSIGPAVNGSSKELLEARILHATYPPGYTPKRPSKMMPAMPYLAKDIDALAEFLKNP